jgi:hypothetical protein
MLDIFTHFLNTWAAIFGVSVFGSLPHSSPGRAVFSAYVICYLVFSIVYQAFLASFFVDPGQQHQISLEEETLTSGLE